MNSSLSLLHPYPFEKLTQLFKDVQPADLPLIPLSIGEPKHLVPEFRSKRLLRIFNTFQLIQIVKACLNLDKVLPIG